MVHVPKIFKVSAKALKSAAVSGVAFVQAHPVAAAFTVVAIVSVSLAFYYSKHSKNRKREDDLTYLSRGNNGHSKDGNSYFYDPETKSITTDIPKSTASQYKTLRKRKVPQSVSSTNENNSSPTQNSRKSNLTLSAEGNDENSDKNPNTDDKVLQNGILINVKAVTGEEKVHEFIRNLSENASVENDRPAGDSHSIETNDENSIDLSSVSNSQSYWIDNSFLDLADFRSESSVGTLLPEQSDWCRACGKNPVNTHTQPCNHRYMCDDCAMRIFRLFKRCKVCRARVEEIIVETS